MTERPITTLLIASDFHLGLRRKANFTSESSGRRERRAREVLRQLYDQPADAMVCCGDFFDRSNNSEDTILDALEFAEFQYDRPLFILAGNHDIFQVADKKASLHVIEEIATSNRQPTQVLFDPTLIDIGLCRLYFLPHCLSQELFLEALDEAERAAPEQPAILFLHCTYNMAFEGTNTSLNLTRERAAQLLKTFRYIFIGHEHTPRTDFDGHLILVGSHYPTAFDNLTDKVHYHVHLPTMTVTRQIHWEAAHHVYCGPADQAVAGYEFYDLEGEVDPKVPVRLFKEGALGVRTPVRLAVDRSEMLAGVTLERLPELIVRELAAHPNQLALWEELTCSTTSN